MHADDSTYWLMLTNLALAFVVLLSGGLVAAAVVWELLKGKGRDEQPQQTPEEKPAEMSIDEELWAMLREESQRILAEKTEGEEEDVPLEKYRRS